MKSKFLLAIPLYLLASAVACGISRIGLDSDDTSPGGAGDDVSSAGGRAPKPSGGSASVTDGGARATGGRAATPSGGNTHRSTGGAGATGGADSAGGSPVVTDGGGWPGGYGGHGGADPVELPGDIVFESERPIESIAANDTHIYWLDYGTQDELENYQFDGKLLRMPVTGGEAEMVVDGLQGPVKLGLSDDAAYVIVDNSVVFDTDGRTEIWRIPFLGKVPEYLSTTKITSRSEFRGLGNEMFWADSSGIYRRTAGGDIERLVNKGVRYFDVDSTHLYFLSSTVNTLSRRSLETGEVEALTERSRDFAVVGPYIISDDGYYVTRMPKDGGVWKRIAAIKQQVRSTRGEGEGYVFTTDVGVELRTLNGPQFIELRIGRRPLDATFDVSPHAFFYAKNQSLYKVDIE